LMSQISCDRQLHPLPTVPHFSKSLNLFTEGIKLDGVTVAKRVTGDLAENHFQTFGTLNRLT